MKIFKIAILLLFVALFQLHATQAKEGHTFRIEGYENPKIEVKYEHAWWEDDYTVHYETNQLRKLKIERIEHSLSTDLHPFTWDNTTGQFYSFYPLTPAWTTDSKSGQMELASWMVRDPMLATQLNAVVETLFENDYLKNALSSRDLKNIMIVVRLLSNENKGIDSSLEKVSDQNSRGFHSVWAYSKRTNAERKELQGVAFDWLPKESKDIPLFFDKILDFIQADLNLSDPLPAKLKAEEKVRDQKLEDFNALKNSKVFKYLQKN